MTDGPYLRVRDISVDASRDTVDVTTFADTRTAFVGGPPTFEFSIRGVVEGEFTREQLTELLGGGGQQLYVTLYRRVPKADPPSSQLMDVVAKDLATDFAEKIKNDPGRLINRLANRQGA